MNIKLSIQHTAEGINFEMIFRVDKTIIIPSTYPLYAFCYSFLRKKYAKGCHRIEMKFLKNVITADVFSILIVTGYFNNKIKI